MKKGLFAFLLFPVFMFSQKDKILFLEGGTSFFVPFQNKSNTSGPLFDPLCDVLPCSTIGNYNQTTKYELATSYYFKSGLDLTFFKKRSFSLSFPFMLGYREQREKNYIETEKIYFNNSPTTKTTETVQRKTDCVSLIFGPKANFQLKKFSFFTALYLNTELSFYYKSVFVMDGQDPRSYQNNSLRMFGSNLSLQNGVIYDITSKFGIGITADVLFYNINPYNIQNNFHNHAFNLSYYPDISSIINTGIRFQYKFNKINGQ